METTQKGELCQPCFAQSSDSGQATDQPSDRMVVISIIRVDVNDITLSVLQFVVALELF